jgi:hypothetical protein
MTYQVIQYETSVCPCARHEGRCGSGRGVNLTVYLYLAEIKIKQSYEFSLQCTVMAYKWTNLPSFVT